MLKAQDKSTQDLSVALTLTFRNGCFLVKLINDTTQDVALMWSYRDLESALNRIRLLGPGLIPPGVL